MKEISEDDIRNLRIFGCCVLPSFLTENARVELLDAVQGLGYRMAERRPPTHRVDQEYAFCDQLDHVPCIDLFARQFQDWLYGGLSQFLPTEFEFNRVIVQKYLPMHSGIEKHVDGPRSRFIVANVCLSGSAHFVVWSSADEPVELDIAPGSIVLMVANGFENWKNTPYHSVFDIKTERYIIGFRCQ